MKKVHLLLSGSIVFLLAGSFMFQSCQEDKPLEVTGNIEGNVVDSETQDNLSGVNVTIVSNSSTTFAEQSKLTGSDGKFSFKGLEAGNYKLTFAKEGYETNSKNIALAAGQTSSSDVSLKSIKPEMNVTPTLLDFGLDVNILPIEIKNAGKGELNWTIVKNLTWLSVYPASGTTTTEPASVNISVDRTLITSESQTGQFVINSNGGSVTVYIMVGTASPVLNVIPTFLDFGQSTNILPLEIKNIGKGELSWSIVKDLPWLSVNPALGNTPAEQTATVNVMVDRALITENLQTGTFLINSNGGNATVNISVSKAGPVLNVTPATLDFGEVEVEKSLNISNVGKETLTYEATCAQSWLTLEGAKGSTSTEINTIKVKVERAGLTTGQYTGNVIINSNSNSITIPVTMSVMQPTAPDVLNGQASSVTHSAAQVSGTIVSLGSSAVTQHGHCWSISPDPTTADNKTTLGGTAVNYSFTSNLSGLTNSTTYYVRAYATNSVGTKYSDQITFTTLAPPTMATVKTLRIENVLHNSVDAVGELTVLGDGFITDYGFCFSSSDAAPTTADSKTSLGSTTNLGEFTGTVTGLRESTKYFIRAYATNSMGTAYGNVIETTTVDAPPLVTSGLVAYYTFDNENCNEVRGRSEYNGFQQGSGNPVWSSDIPGKTGKSLELSNNVYFQIPTSPFASSTSEYSVSIWVKTMNNGNIFFGHLSSSTNYYPMVGIPANNKIYCIGNNNMTNYDTSSQFDFDVNTMLLDGNWHMVTITRKSGVFKLFIDGTYLANKSNTRNVYGNAPMLLGRSFTGKMDNFRAYNRELTQAEITELFNAKQ